jgi:ribonuclease HI
MQSLENIQKLTPEETIKGKKHVGIVRLNFDGAYMDRTGCAGSGMIMRRDDGNIVFSACRPLRFCSSALESEMSACLEGTTRALEATTENIIIETDVFS